MHDLIALVFALCTASAWTTAEAKESPACISGQHAILAEERGDALLQSSLMSNSIPNEESLSPASTLIPGYDPSTPQGVGAAPLDNNIVNGVDLASTDHSDGYYYHGASMADSGISKPETHVVTGEVGSDAQLSFDSTSTKAQGAGGIRSDILGAASPRADVALGDPQGSSLGTYGLPPNILAATSHAKAALSGDDNALGIDALASSNSHGEAMDITRGAQEAAVLPDGALSNGEAPPLPDAALNLANDLGDADAITHPTLPPPSTSAMLSVSKVADQTSSVASSHGQQEQLSNGPQQLLQPLQEQQAEAQPRLQLQPLQSQQMTPPQQALQPQQVQWQQLQPSLQVPQLPTQQNFQPQPQQWQPQQLSPQQILQQPQQMQIPLVSVAPAQLVGQPLNTGLNTGVTTNVAGIVPLATPVLNTPLPQRTMMAWNSGTPQILVAQPDVAVPKPSPEATSLEKMDSTINTTSSNTSSSFADPRNGSTEAPSMNVTTPFPEDNTGCRTRDDDRAVVWYMETAPQGTPCIFGVDPRDEGRHCIFDQGKFGSNGWCYTDKDRYAWGSCNDNCPLYGMHAALGRRIDSVGEQVDDVSKQLEEMLGTTATTTFFIFPVSPAPELNPKSSTASVAATPIPEAVAVTSIPEVDSIETSTASPTSTARLSTTPLPVVGAPPAPSGGPLPPASAPESPASAPESAPMAAAPVATNTKPDTSKLAAAPGAWPGTTAKPELAAAPGPFPGDGKNKALMQHQAMASNSGIDTSNTVWNQILVAAQRHDAGTLRQLLSGA